MKKIILPFAEILVNFLWYVYSKIFKCKVSYKTNIVEFKMLPVGHISKEIFGERFFGKFEYKERLFVENFLKIDSNIVNIGANIGFYTLLSSCIAKDGSVFAFEPSSENFKNLNNNIELNSFGNIHAFNVGIGDFDGQLELYRDVANPELDSHYTLTNENSNNIVLEKILINRLDTFLPQFPDNIDLVIIDVEGYEFEALIGARKFLETHSNATFLIETTKNHVEVVDLMKSLNFKVFTLSDSAVLFPATNFHGNLIFKKD